MVFDVIIVGGGAAGFFAAIQIAQHNPSLKIIILERGKEVLTKVRVSGGGRCNVTHAEFIPNELAKAYPRGKNELKGPFHTFCSGDTVAFFEERGVSLKTEDDGRMFPETDNSQSIIDCFLSETQRLGVKINTQCTVKKILPLKEKEANWQLETSQTTLNAKKVLLATGSNPKVWKLLEQLGHNIVAPVPSLFTFNIKDQRINGLMGLSTQAEIHLLKNNEHPIIINGKQKAIATGPLLITHWGMSGPAILKLSAWGARELFSLNYQFKIKVNWLPQYLKKEITDLMQTAKTSETKKTVFNTRLFNLPKRLWFKILESCGIHETLKWADVNKKQLENLTLELTEAIFEVNGKSTFKEEFVTAGGVALKEVDFKTYQSKLFEGLYFAGEILNIDAITGGYNFQNAWTGAYIAAQAITEELA